MKFIFYGNTDGESAFLLDCVYEKEFVEWKKKNKTSHPPQDRINDFVLYQGLKVRIEKLQSRYGNNIQCLFCSEFCNDKAAKSQVLPATIECANYFSTIFAIDLLYK